MIEQTVSIACWLAGWLFSAGLILSWAIAPPVWRSPPLAPPSAPSALLNPEPAAENWQLTGQTANGLARQYVDLNSITGSAPFWTVHSYFIEQRADGQADGPIRADYLTLYDCDRQRYKDIAPDGTAAPTWGDAAADPLNQATMDYVCGQMSGPGAGNLADAPAPLDEGL
ncbi:MAG: hypothetical protein HC824_16495 [Synechococcales cyanobacterium RM1_1_8]|nr:hypothetical protein [Synechococcales cyanobacterium RM1_1_8]